MKTTFLTRLIAGSLITATLFTACSKNNTIDELNNGPQQTTSASKMAVGNSAILNQELRVTYARDNGTDITEQLNDWTFKFAGNHPSGEAQAWNDLLSSTGTWSMAEGSSTISISYPSTLSQLVFMSKTWTVGNNNNEIVLTAPDGDEVRLAPKK